MDWYNTRDVWNDKHSRVVQSFSKESQFITYGNNNDLNQVLFFRPLIVFCTPT